MRDIIRLFCGIEGGGTKTVVEIADESGKIVAQVTGSSSNPWSLGSRKDDGFVIAARVFTDLIEQALKQIEIDENSNRINCNLVSLAICYSGGGSEVANKRMMNALKGENGIDKNCKIYLGNDCLAPIFTAFKNGGMVLISGTGSNCILVNPIEQNKQLHSLDQIKCCNSGGWGNLLGDEGSAYWIAQKAIKYLIDVNDNFIERTYDCDHLEQLVFEHFKIKSLLDLLPYFYSDFKKAFIAGLTLKLSLLAEKNNLIQSFFEEAGYKLARHIVAILPKIDKELLNCSDGLPVICAGSVYKSWDIMKPGFLDCLKDNASKCTNLKKINLVKIEGHSAVGAVILAAKLYEQNMEFLQKFNYNSVTSSLDEINLDDDNKLMNTNNMNNIKQNNILSLNFFASYIKGILW